LASEYVGSWKSAAFLALSLIAFAWVVYAYTSNVIRYPMPWFGASIAVLGFAHCTPYLADPIVAQARPLTNRERTSFVANQSQRQIQALAVPRVTVVRHSHGRPLLRFAWFWHQKEFDRN
jgi:hypothetical protein